MPPLGTCSTTPGTWHPVWDPWDKKGTGVSPERQSGAGMHGKMDKEKLVILREMILPFLDA